LLDERLVYASQHGVRIADVPERAGEAQPGGVAFRVQVGGHPA
jgi:hypothetical protein